MPLKLVPPEKIKGATSIYIRGTYLGVRVYRSTGVNRESLAVAERKRIEREIESGRYQEPAPGVTEAETFAHACVAYLRECPAAEAPRIKRLLAVLHATPLTAFGKDLVDQTEREMFPGYYRTADDKKTGRLTPYTGATLNREFRAPLGAVLHHAAARGKGPKVEVARHAEGQRTKFLEPDAAARLIQAAAEVDAAARDDQPGQLAALLVTLFTTGLRISEACRIDWPLINLERGEIGPLVTKNGVEYMVAIGPAAVVAIANIPGLRVAGRKVFGFRDRHAVKYPLSRACEIAGMVRRGADGKALRDRNRRAKPTFTLHQARHSFGTWLRRNGEDLRKMMELGRWKDVRSVMRYSHVAPQEHAPALARLPLQVAPTPPAADTKSRTRVKGGKT